MNMGRLEPGFVAKATAAAAIASLFVVGLFLLKTAFNVLLLVMAGVLIAVYFRGLSYSLSDRTGLSRRVSLWVVAAGTLLALGLLGWTMGARLKEQAAEMEETIPAQIEATRAELGRSAWGRALLANVPGLSGSGGAPGQDAPAPPKQPPEAEPGPALGAEGEEPPAQGPAGGGFEEALRAVRGLFSSTFGFLGDLYVILFLGLFFTMDPDLYRRGIVRLFPLARRAQADAVLVRLGHTLYGWLRGQLLAMLIVGVITGIGLWILGVPLALLLALIAALFNFIPNFGPLAAGVPAVLLALTQGPGLALSVAGMYLVIQGLEGNFITPLIQKRMIELPPALEISGQVLLGVLAGALGVIVAVPAVAIAMVLVESVYIEGALGEEPS